MKTTTFIYSYLLFFILTISCTTNNGDIGPIMGKWQLQKAIIDNETYYFNNLFFNFQSNVIEIQKRHEDLVTTSMYGSYSIKDNELSYELNNDFRLNEIILFTKIESFYIEHNSMNKLVISNNKYMLEFRKF